ncbi:MAG: hypothetical protein JKY54_19700 [Flavobacteriales bacterium]|nr:hypothetical protein [Flavobacteriales bacterium]
MLKYKRHIILFVTIISTMFVSGTVVKNEVEFKNKTVSVFKDGSGFFIKEAIISNAQKRLYFTDNLPKATFGTFWFFSNNQNLAGVSSYADTVHTFVKVKKSASNLKELLKKNVSKKVDVLWSRKQGDQTIERLVSGKLIWFSGNLVTIKSDNKFETINFNEITNVKFQSQPVFESEEEVENVAYKPVLQIDFHKKTEKEKLEMMYLTKGITWIPGYYIELKKNGRARVILRSTLINDAEDIENSDVNFVVGVPNFQYANELSPIFGSKQVSNFLGKLDVNYQPLQTMNLNNFSNSIRSYNVSPNQVTPVVSENPLLSESIKSLTANSSQDMFFYTAKNVSLKKGGRGFYNIFEINVPVSHIYECNLKTSGSASLTNRNHFSFSDNKSNPVHHSIRLKNSSEFPFTTGPALVVSKENGHLEPLSQDKIKYTPIGGTSYLKMTEAIDIFVSENETIKKKVEKKKRYPNKRDTDPWYDLVTIKGTITIKNHKSKEADLHIKKTIYGEIIESKDGVMENISKQKLARQLNNVNQVLFNVKMKAKEKRVIHYTYRIYIRH